ncbi:hypothetical protein [Commensalibacter papalotli (ex Botero et al. 2024)]|uniref:Uncharacterized protein n=1 Tax=Commensalibacter papalotli (ex Botero et al. 2024) TaxID=2972766 RepID=A0ABM9HSJ6_9PROT|nr:hypothetical protein [Commensalibacter papalotli (ex Botero et al. 2024)]CAI3952462.1 unnamed protein product [Commensalibacter papalotli (ex Botero et al. 2024)]CAI3957282.1 unnamed protein product [Commensalibacter papalotli (ex Botero et al. 2024)]
MGNYEIGLPRHYSMQYNPSTECSVFGIYNKPNDYLDCNRDDYRMYSSLLQDTYESDAILIAKELLSLFLGYSKIFDKDRYLVNDFDVSKITEWKMPSRADYLESYNFELIDTTHNFTVNSFTLDMYNVPIYYLREIYDKNIDAKADYFRLTNNFFNFLLYLSNKYDDIYILLKICALEIDWVNLYRIYESLDDIVKIQSSYPYLKEEKGKKDKIIKCLDIKKNRDRLTRPANNFSILGLSSRHGYKPNATAKKQDDDFSLSEAKEFVFSHVKNYLSWRVKCEAKELNNSYH